MDIYVQKDGQRRGPFSEAQIRSGFDSGEFAPADLAWANGKASWQPLSALINLDVNQSPPFDHPPSSSPTAVVAGAVSAMPPLSTKWNTFRVAIALLAVGFAVCLLLAFAWQSWSSDHVDAKTWAMYNERQGFEKDQTDPRSRAATMRGNEEAFIAKYGKPLKVAHGAQPPATDDLLFRNGDLVYEVSFWYGSAHNVLVWRWDDNPLTEQDIEKGLAAFSEGEEWALQSHAGPHGIDIWRRIGVVAFVEDVRSKVPDAPETIPVNDLRIVTEELLAKKGSDQ